MKLLGSDPTTPQGARKAVRYAGIAGFVSAGLTLAMILFIQYSRTDLFGSLVSLWSLFDVALLAGLAWGTYRANRFAAVGLLAYYMLNQTILRMVGGQGGGLVLALLFVVLFAQGVRGAFTLHRLGADADDPLVDRVDAIADPEAEATV